MENKTAFCGDLEADNAHFDASLTLPACRDSGSRFISAAPHIKITPKGYICFKDLYYLVVLMFYKCTVSFRSWFNPVFTCAKSLTGYYSYYAAEQLNAIASKLFSWWYILCACDKCL